MKVTLEKDYKRFYTIDDLSRAKAVIKYEKDNDEDTPAGWLAYAVNEFYKDRFDLGLERIIEAKAETAKNNRAWNLYGNADDETENMDVWISGLAKTYTGYIEIGAYLSDIWQTGATPYKEHIFAIEYSRNN